MSSPSSSTVDPTASAGSRTGPILQALLAAAFGLLLLAGAGFAQIDAVHNAAHDTRHATAFPCH